MPRRHLLRRGLIAAWTNCIEKNCEKPRINSERSLQAAFWAELSEVLHESRRIFIEPCIQLDDRRYFPDLVICNTREIIGIIEIKYTPRAKIARVKKDIRTLCELANWDGEISVSHRRYRGVAVSFNSYRVSRHVLMAWAGVHGQSLDGVKPRFASLVDMHHGVGCHSLLQLHAITRDKEDPVVCAF